MCGTREGAEGGFPRTVNGGYSSYSALDNERDSFDNETGKYIYSRVQTYSHKIHSIKISEHSPKTN